MSNSLSLIERDHCKLHHTKINPDTRHLIPATSQQCANFYAIVTLYKAWREILVSPHSHFSPFSEQSRKIILPTLSSSLTWTTVKASHLGSLYPHLFPTVNSLWSHHSRILKMFMSPPCFRHPKAHHLTLEPKVLAEFIRSAKGHHLLPSLFTFTVQTCLSSFSLIHHPWPFICYTLYCKI